MRLPFLLLLPALALAACSLTDDGPKTTQTRDVAAFNRIENSDSADVHLHVGRPQQVRVRAGEKVIDDVHTDVRDGTLRVTFDHHGIGPSEVVVDAYVPRLTAIAADGSGKVAADGVDGAALAVSSDDWARSPSPAGPIGSRSTSTVLAEPISKAAGAHGACERGWLGGRRGARRRAARGRGRRLRRCPLSRQSCVGQAHRRLRRRSRAD